MAAVLKDTLKITKIKEHIGAEVTGVDLRRPLDAATKKRLYDAAVEQRGARHPRPVRLHAREYQTAAEIFGELMEDQNRRYLVDGVPLVSVLDNRFTKDSKGNPAKVGKNAPGTPTTPTRNARRSSRCSTRWRCRTTAGQPRSATCARRTRRCRRNGKTASRT